MLSTIAKTFALIFLAELGDKTQFTAFALAAATPGGKWAIFIGSAAALAATSLLAVVAGDAVSRIGMTQRTIKVAAGLMLVLAGIATLVSAVRN